MSPSISVAMEEWEPGPALSEGARCRVAGGNRPRARARGSRNGMLPAFYFDVAEWLFRKRRGVEAVEMLLSALDLPLANEETASMVADRLLRYGRIERAIWLYERALRAVGLSAAAAAHARAGAGEACRATSPAPAAARRPAPRDEAAQRDRASTPWEGRATTASRWWRSWRPTCSCRGSPRWARRQIPLDPRLRALLDVDLRVVIEWNTGATDMDLWVDEPTASARSTATRARRSAAASRTT